MNFLAKAAAMLGFRKQQAEDRPKKDIMAADLSVALSRNERASRSAQDALEEMLSKNDELRKGKN